MLHHAEGYDHQFLQLVLATNTSEAAASIDSFRVIGAHRLGYRDRAE